MKQHHTVRATFEPKTKKTKKQKTKLNKNQDNCNQVVPSYKIILLGGFLCYHNCIFSASLNRSFDCNFLLPGIKIEHHMYSCQTKMIFNYNFDSQMLIYVVHHCFLYVEHVNNK